MASIGTQRRFWAEVRFSADRSSISIYSNRTVYDYWHFLEPHFGQVLLAPQWRAVEGRATWTWEQPSGPRPTGEALAKLRRLLAAAADSVPERLQVDAPSGLSLAAAPASIRDAVIGRGFSIVRSLAAKTDEQLSQFAGRTLGGLRIHSWGSPAPAKPFSFDSPKQEIKGRITIEGMRRLSGEIALEDWRGVLVERTRPETDGTFVFSAVEAGLYKVSARIEGAALDAPEVSVNVFEDESSEVNFHGTASGADAAKPAVGRERHPQTWRPLRLKSRRIAAMFSISVILVCLWLFYRHRTAQSTTEAGGYDRWMVTAGGKAEAGDQAGAGRGSARSGMGPATGPAATIPKSESEPEGRSYGGNSGGSDLAQNVEGAAGSNDGDGSATSVAGSEPNRKKTSGRPASPGSEDRAGSAAGVDSEMPSGIPGTAGAAESPEATPVKSFASEDASEALHQALRSAAKRTAAASDSPTSTASSNSNDDTPDGSGSNSPRPGAATRFSPNRAQASPGGAQAQASARSSGGSAGLGRGSGGGGESAANPPGGESAAASGSGAGASAKAAGTKDSDHSDIAANDAAGSTASNGSPSALNSKAKSQRDDAPAQASNAPKEGEPPAKNRQLQADDAPAANSSGSTDSKGHRPGAAEQNKTAVSPSEVSSASGAPATADSAATYGGVANSGGIDRTGAVVDPLIGNPEETVAERKWLLKSSGDSPGDGGAIPRTLLVPRFISGFAVDFVGAPGAAPPVWRYESGKEALEGSVSGNRAEFSWSDLSAPAGTDCSLIASDGRALARVVVNRRGEATLFVAESARGWYWVGVERAANDDRANPTADWTRRFDWKLPDGHPLPGGWRRDDSWLGGRGHRLDMPLAGDRPLNANIEIALEDRLTGWMLVGTPERRLHNY